MSQIVLVVCHLLFSRVRFARLFLDGHFTFPHKLFLFASLVSWCDVFVCCPIASFCFLCASVCPVLNDVGFSKVLVYSFEHCLVFVACGVCCFVSSSLFLFTRVLESLYSTSPPAETRLTVHRRPTVLCFEYFDVLTFQI